MEFLRPTSLAEALAAKAAQPDAVPIAGGTDVMVELNFDHRRPAALLDLTRVGELAEWSTVDDRTARSGSAPASRTPGSSPSWANRCPAWRWPPARSGSPQIRNRGTVGGNLGAASPAGDTHPVLLATDATDRGGVRARHADDSGGGVLPSA